MLRIFRGKKKPEEQKNEEIDPVVEIPVEQADAETPEPVTPPPPEKLGWFGRLKKGLTKTRENFANGLSNLFLGKKTIDADLLEQLEMHLLTADVGVAATQKIIAELTNQVKRRQLNDVDALMVNLKELLSKIIQPCEQNLIIPASVKPYVILLVGVNGAGKTTTIGKLAKQLQLQGKKVMLAAGDTFRAAAIEQLQVWGERNQIPVIAQHSGADSAAVIFDAVQAARARDMDVVLADTAGRLHTQNNLMDELKKIKRVLTKIDANLPHEVLLILDASIGQNALQQAKQFKDAVGVTGIVMTKLDGTAKGGILFAIAEQLHLPFRYIGVGEAIDDLRPFVADDFVNALFSVESA